MKRTENKSSLSSSVLTSRTSKVCIIQECKRQIKTTVGFSLCTISLLVTWVTYFRLGLGNLKDKKPLEDIE